VKDAPYRKKLIEVALPLEAINRESAREKSIRHGHPSTLHLWWARRPLAACRAVLFASLVDDPSSHPEQFPTEEAQEAERQRLFRIIEQLVKWENTTNEQVLAAARAEIQKATDGNPPPVLDPFCGGGSIPLEAQRLGLEVHASDLNPVAVLITKALIEIPPRFAGQPPVNPEARRKIGHADGWRGAQGLAEDVRYYGKWMRDEAERRIGHLYPKVKLPPEQGGGEATVIAWLWARTVRCPNPACGAEMPLVRSFWLSTKKGKQAWVEPIFDRAAKTVRFEVRTGQGVARAGTVGRQGATCLVCGTSASLAYVRSEAQASRMRSTPLATVAETRRGRAFVATDSDHVAVARSAKPKWRPEELVTTPSHDVDRLPMYGMKTWGEAFTPRQLVALTTFCDLVGEARERARADALAAGLPDDGVPLNDGGAGAAAYADAVATYLAFALDRSADRGSTICTWDSSPKMEALRATFARQAIPMTWDFAEGNPFSESSGNWVNNVEWTATCLGRSPCRVLASVRQSDAGRTVDAPLSRLACTDPPYYDNIGYADLADYFYVWLRRSVGALYPDLFGTLLTPKAEELVASPYRFVGNRDQAAEFFEQGLTATFQRMRDAQHPDYPLTAFYAFKQAESEDDSGRNGGATVSSTGWETMLEGLMKAGLVITGTWPVRSELATRNVGRGTNALASSIVLVCRPRPDSAPVTNRREFLAELKRELPPALRMLQREGIAPVDLAQAAIGPGMAVFSRYHRVLEADGSAMPVRTALALINEALDAVLAEQEGEFDAETRWAVAWFEQFGANEGAFGVAETLSKAKNTALNALVEAGIVQARQGRVRLLRRDELPADWDPIRDRRVTIWEVTQHLIRRLEDGGEQAAARLLAQVGGLGEAARDLAYRLYVAADRKKWAQEALGYNSLVVAWPEVRRLAGASGRPEQGELL